MKNINSIPIMELTEDIHEGVSIRKWLPTNGSVSKKVDQSHRHDFHIFLLQQKGQACVEIDFHRYDITAKTILYLHPNQVHRLINQEDVEFCIISIKSEFIQRQYLKVIEELVPAKPLSISSDSCTLLNKSFSLCSTLFQNYQGKFYDSALLNSCNAFASLLIAQYIEFDKPTEYFTRAEIVTKEFKLLLEKNYVHSKRPFEFAKLLHISSPYLNQCVRNTTGFSVSYHIQQRVILEAKRLLFHSDASIKEIAAMLGYEDYAYFSRLFAKVCGIPAIEFRKRILD